jgi:parallel beta-helix repeat protein
MMLLLLITSLLVLAVKVQPVKARGTIYIRADGSIDPPTAPIQRNGDTYTLTGNITADADGIVIERDNIVVDGASYVVTGTGIGKGTTLTSISDVTVRKMTITNFLYGIELSYSSGNTLSGNNVANNYYGISLGSSSGNTLSGNNVTTNIGWGLQLSSSSGNTLSGNNVTANSEYGIWLGSSSDSTLAGNAMVGNRYNFDVGGSVLSDFLQSVDTSNLVDGKPVYYFVNQSDMVVNADAYPEVGYLGFVNCANVTVQGMNLTNNGQGLLLEYTNDSKITGNNIANNYYGISLGSSSGNTLSGNNVTTNIGWGLQLSSSSGNTLSGNNAANNYYGIRLDSSSDNALFGNNVGNNWDGIVLDSSSNNALSGNNVTANSEYGIWLDSSSDNTLAGNAMARNGYNFDVGGSVLSDFLQSVDTSNLVNGKPVYYFVNQSDMVVNADAYPEVGYLGFVNCANVTVQGMNLTSEGQGLLLAYTTSSKITDNNFANNYYGIWLDSSSGNTLSGNNAANNEFGIVLGFSSNNLIFQDSFVNNTNQAYTYFSANIWDDGYPSGGSYWSDYHGVDVKKGPGQDVSGSDEIGDTAYVIDENNTDHYPLILNPLVPAHDIAVNNVVLSKTVIGRGFNGNVSVYVTNDGEGAETLSVSAYANATTIGTQQVNNLNARSTT